MSNPATSDGSRDALSLIGEGLQSLKAHREQMAAGYEATAGASLRPTITIPSSFLDEDLRALVAAKPSDFSFLAFLLTLQLLRDVRGGQRPIAPVVTIEPSPVFETPPVDSVARPPLPAPLE